MKSLRELYRIGVGPSSSHTMGPAAAATDFKAAFPDAAAYTATLFGSLAATGRGHFTDKAIEDIFGHGRTKIIWKSEVIKPFHPNAVTFVASSREGKPLGEATYYSVGGGAIVREGEKTKSPEVYRFKTMAEILRYCDRKGLSMWQLVDAAEGPKIWDYLETVRETMMAAVERGLAADGALPGALHLPRKARTLHLQASMQAQALRRTGLLVSYAHAVAEENAARGIIVTAPTCGSCGVIPAVLRYLGETMGSSRMEILHALAIAGVVGNVVKRNGSLSGAEVGCQGEVGVACAMAAAAAAYLMGGTPRQCECAAEVGLEHFLGLTCDPVMGLVQVPCIERNAFAATRALVAGEMAVLGDGSHIVSFDTVVKTMLETGHDLPCLYRETSAGGLSRNVHR